MRNPNRPTRSAAVRALLANARTPRVGFGAVLIALLAPVQPLTAQATSAPPDSARLAARLAAVLDTGTLARVHWGIDVRDAASGSVIYGRNAERLFIPASNLKLVVAAAAAHHLPADYRYRTTFLAGGPVRDGTLEGDLIVHGRGDPAISGRWQSSMSALLESFADSLRAHGINRITGAIVADETEWPHEGVHGDWEVYDVNWWYAAATGPLGFNDNSIDFRVAPGELGSPARITWQPETRAFQFRNETRTIAAGGRNTLDFGRVPGTDTIFAYGEIPVGTAPRSEHFAVRDPAHYFGTVLAEVLARRGISVAPRVRIVRPPAAAPAGSVLFEHRSPPLPQLIAPILQTSQNWFAEQVVRTLGREVAGEGSWRAGLEVEARFLGDVVGIDTAAFLLRDASGLSSGNLIAPAALSALLVHVHSDPRQQPVIAALPVSAAETGSLRTRFEDLPGRVRAKTGSIRNVDSLSGFLRTGSGREVAFSIIANGTGQARTRAAIDAAVRILAADL